MHEIRRSIIIFPVDREEIHNSQFSEGVMSFSYEYFILTLVICVAPHYLLMPKTPCSLQAATNSLKKCLDRQNT